MVRAKFKVTQKNFYPDAGKLVLEPVMSGSQENAEFFKWTPGGKIEMDVLSHETLNRFEVGEEYYVDFSPVSSE